MLGTACYLEKEKLPFTAASLVREENHIPVSAYHLVRAILTLAVSKIVALRIREGRAGRLNWAPAR